MTDLFKIQFKTNLMFTLTIQQNFSIDAVF